MYRRCLYDELRSCDFTCNVKFVQPFIISVLRATVLVDMFILIFRCFGNGEF